MFKTLWLRKLLRCLCGNINQSNALSPQDHMTNGALRSFIMFNTILDLCSFSLLNILQVFDSVVDPSLTGFLRFIRSATLN